VTHLPSVHALVLQSVVFGQSLTLAHSPDGFAPELELDVPPLPPPPSCVVVDRVKQPAAMTKPIKPMDRPKALEPRTPCILSSVFVRSEDNARA
jgi:hypothetical protein